MRFTVYDTATGEIKRSGSCGAKDFLRQAKEGEAVIEGRGNDLTEIVIDGKLQPKTTGE